MIELLLFNLRMRYAEWKNKSQDSYLIGYDVIERMEKWTYLG